MRRVSMLVVTMAVASVARAAAAPAEVREHELRVGGPVSVTAGERAAASLTIVPAAGRHIEPDAPLSLRLSVTPATGLDLPRRRYALADAADPRAEAPRFDLALAGAAPGSYTLRVEARFWLCGTRSCRAVRDAVDIPVTVEAGGAPSSTPR